jgi:hypothetical protein
VVEAIANNYYRWVCKFDLDMQRQNRLIVLVIDNFSGHYIAYQPKNIEIVYFEPNITSHIQPLDAGIICCFKALY